MGSIIGMLGASLGLLVQSALNSGGKSKKHYKRRKTHRKRKSHRKRLVHCKKNTQKR
jgi:hypothetical protein